VCRRPPVDHKESDDFVGLDGIVDVIAV